MSMPENVNRSGSVIRIVACFRSLALALVLGFAGLVIPGPAWATGADGARLFEATCAGCHPHGGNIIRRGRTLRIEALQRRGLDGEAAIAAVVAGGVGQMAGYGAALGDSGVETVAAWVWQQALEGWPRS
jgi:mono/diheme cytochrome c family protein